MNEPQSKDIQDYIGAFKRRRAQIAATFVAIFGIGLFVSLAWPPTYRSAATILIEEQQIPSDLVQSTVTSYASQRIQTISQRVMTRSNLLEIIDKFNLYVDERKRETSEEILQRMREDIQLDMISADVIDPRTGRPMAATIAFSLAFEGESPAHTQKVANELTSLYLQENLKTRATNAEETLTFLTDEANRLQNDITELDATLAEFKSKNSESLPELEGLLRGQLERADRELSDTKIQIRAVQERQFYLQGQLAQLDPYGADVNTSPGTRLKALRTEYASALSRYSPTHPDVLRLKREIESMERETGGQVNNREVLLDQIATLKLEQARVNEKYSDQHPDVLRLQRQISELEETLTKTPANSETDTRRNPDNPAFVALQAQQNSNINELQALNSKLSNLEAKRTEIEERLTSIPQVEGEYRTLMRDLDNAVLKFREIKAKQMQAQVAQQLESESKGERFTLIDPAVLPEEPIKPNRPAIIFLSLILALGAGLGYATIAESMNNSIRGMKGVINALHAAPLAVIPYLATDREISQGRLHRRRLVLAAAGLVVIAIILAHFFVSPLDVLWFRILRKLTKLTGIGLE